VATSKRSIASTLDTALLVFVVLLVLAAAWWVLKAVIGTVLFFAQLAVLALLVAVAVRAYLWVRGRTRRRPEPKHL
jgi:positive regulator of sigma E activity